MRMQFLDTARALAVIYVVFFHTIGIWNLEYPDAIKRLVQFGGSSVILFFVVSGFSLCYTMQRHLSNTNPLMSYSVTRFFRIAPLYYVLLILTIIRDFYFRDITHSPEKILFSSFFIFNFSPEYAKGIVWASWTIGVEVVFYALFPLLYKILNSLTKKINFFIVLVWVTYFFAEFFIPLIDPAFQSSYKYMNFPRNLAVFVLGMISYDLYKSTKEKNLRESTGATIILLAFSLLASMAILAKYTWNKVLIIDFGIMQGIGYLILVIGLSAYSTRNIFNSIANFYSKICYSAYLWHPFLIWSLKPIYDSIYSYDLSVAQKLIVSFSVTMIALSILGEISFRLIEKPGQNFGKKILLLKQKNQTLAHHRIENE